MSDQPSNSVFISYRRSANPYLALAVYQDLQNNGIDTFYDIEAIDSGKFDTIILNQITARPYFIPIFTPGTLDRCVESGDWLRREIEHAMNNDRVIIPLHTPDFSFKDIETFLPGLIARELSRWNAFELPQKQFRLVMQDLRIRILKPVAGKVKAAPASDAPDVARKQAGAAAAAPVTERQLTAQEYFERALAQQNKGDLDGALADYTEALRLNPQYAAAYLNRGIVRAAQKDYRGAVADYEARLRLRPDDPQKDAIRAEIERLRKLIG